MEEIRERFIVDETGARVGVLLNMSEYRKLMEALEELESIREYDEAKASGDELISFETATREIESKR